MEPPPVSVNLGPPSFTDVMPSLISIKIGQTYMLTFPKISDPDPTDKATLTIENFRAIALFSEKKPKELLLRPSIEGQVGNYTITVVLKDDNTKPLASRYQIEIRLYSDKIEQKEIKVNKTES